MADDTKAAVKPKAKTDPFSPNDKGLVAVQMLVSAASLGLRRGEIRGVSPDVARAMVEKKSARVWADDLAPLPPIEPGDTDNAPSIKRGNDIP